MLVGTARQLDRWIGIAGSSPYDSALLRERLAALKRQLPWMHGMLLASLTGMVAALRAQGTVSTAVSQGAILVAPALLLIGIILVRACYLLCVHAEELSTEETRRELRKTALTACFYFVVSLSWQLGLYFRLPAQDAADIPMFAGIAALGASAGLSSFPAAAKIPLVVGAVPFAVLLTLAPKPAHQAIGLTLLVVVAVRLRLINVQNLIFERLVRSRFSVEIEKKRALEAEQEALTEQLRVEEMANTDPLTGLINRRGFLAKLQSTASVTRRRLAIILLDLDGFKAINDTFGHAIGDEILVEVSQRLRRVSSEDVAVARLGGDEFALLCPSGSAREALMIAKQAIASLSAPYWLQQRHMRISACAGVSYWDDDNIADGMRRADIALYDAKRRARGGVAVFTREMERDVQRRTAIEQALREPDLAADIQIAYQPIFELETLQLASFEALARWCHPELGWISPSEFIPITEQISVLHQISDALLSRAAAAARQWPESVRLSFNLSPVQLCSQATARKVLEILARARLDPQRLDIEVTETALLADFDAARGNLSELRRAGVRIVMDDFGAGYSSISYLREMAFDVVKLDGSLITSMTTGGTGIPLLQGVLALCGAMGQECVAEHIETDQHVEMLRRLGCKYGQGFGLCPPMGEQEAAELIRSGVLKTDSCRRAVPRKPVRRRHIAAASR